MHRRWSLLLLPMLGLAALADDLVDVTVPSSPPLAVDAPTQAPARPRALLDPVRRHLDLGDVVGARQLAAWSADTLDGEARALATLADAALADRAGDAAAAARRWRALASRVDPLGGLAATRAAASTLEAGDAATALTLADAADRHRYADRHAVLATRALALVALGRVTEAVSAATAWDKAERHGANLAEQVALRAALAMPDPVAGDALTPLTTRFLAARTARRAEAALVELRGRGIAVDPVDDDASLRARAEHLRDTGRLDEAWDLFTTLRRDATDPDVRAWIAAQGVSFARATRRWDEVVAHYRAAPLTADTQWDAWRAAARGGRWTDANAWILDGLTRHGRSGRWRGSDELLGRTLLAGGAYPEAAARFDVGAGDRGETARQQLFLASFARHLAGQHDAARVGYDRLITAPGASTDAARYWRSRLPGQPAESVTSDHAWLLEHDPDGWYATLVRRPVARPHDGGWPGHDRTGRWTPTALDPVLSGPPAPLATLPAAADLLAHPMLPRLPSAYPAGPFHDPVADAALLDEVAETWGLSWPDLALAAAFSAAGLTDEAGPHLAAAWDAWRRDLSAGRADARALNATLGSRGWLPLFYAARDHHHTARNGYLLHRQIADPVGRLNTERLEFPIAHGLTAWSAGEAHDLDPWLVLGLMRTESTYQAHAVSRVGARGPMQIMPRTGHLLADLLADDDFTTADLHDPETAVRYGVRYLALLEQRFGAWPAAVAAYNAGPHNVSAWLAGMGPEPRVDVFAEIIPFHETRGYVRKVTAATAAYLRLYESADHALTAPVTIPRDDAHVVDF